MQLVITEKNIAAQKIAQILSTSGKPKEDKVYKTSVYRFVVNGEDWVAIGLRGHILRLELPDSLEYSKKKWEAVLGETRIAAPNIPCDLAHPPFDKPKRPFTTNGVILKQWKIPTLPYLTYAPIVKEPGEKEIIRAVKTLAKKADRVIIATDFDREGELIGNDAAGIVRAETPSMEIKRVRYSAITKQEITQAFNSLTDIDEALAAAGDSRRYIDLLWGAVLTRYLTVVKFSGIGNTRSAGRVQTPTLCLIAQRENERRAFVPEPYWVLEALFTTKESQSFKGKHKTTRFLDQAQAQKAFDAVKDAQSATVVSVEKKERTIPAPIPFNTTGLQAAAAAEGISPARTMRLAETLYMEGFTSYPRVDNTVYPASLDLKDIVTKLGMQPEFSQDAKAILSKGELKATRGKTETTDHPPIHPTGAGDPSKLGTQERKLYNLIVRRFFATLSDAAKVEGTKLTLVVNGEQFIARGDVTTYAGFRAVYPYGLKKEEELPALKEGEEVQFSKPNLLSKETEPPARFSQGKLIQKMEELGLGTKSTRHAIIERLYEVKYIINDPIEPTELGLAIADALIAYAPDITTADMTKRLESEMSAICEQRNDFESVVMHSRDLLNDVLHELLPSQEQIRDKISDAALADSRVGTCPKCGGDLVVRYSGASKSSFIGCNKWPECDVTYPLPQGKIESVEDACPYCSSPQIKVTAFRSKPVIQCVDPQCKSNQEPEVVIGACPNCLQKGLDKKLITKKSNYTLKRFIRCENYDECQTSFPLPQKGKVEATGETCPECGAPLVDIINARGPWRICVNMKCPSKENASSDTKKKTTRSSKTKKK